MIRYLGPKQTESPQRLVNICLVCSIAYQTCNYSLPVLFHLKSYRIFMAAPHRFLCSLKKTHCHVAVSVYYGATANKLLVLQSIPEKEKPAILACVLLYSGSRHDRVWRSALWENVGRMRPGCCILGEQQVGWHMLAHQPGRWYSY